jgi:hypothetical protein
VGKGHSGTINAVKISPDEKVQRQPYLTLPSLLYIDFTVFIVCCVFRFLLWVCSTLHLSVRSYPPATQTLCSYRIHNWWYSTLLFADYCVGGQHRGNIVLGDAIGWSVTARTEQLNLILCRIVQNTPTHTTRLGWQLLCASCRCNNLPKGRSVSSTADRRLLDHILSFVYIIQRGRKAVDFSWFHFIVNQTNTLFNAFSSLHFWITSVERLKSDLF